MADTGPQDNNLHQRAAKALNTLTDSTEWKVKDAKDAEKTVFFEGTLSAAQLSRIEIISELNPGLIDQFRGLDSSEVSFLPDENMVRKLETSAYGEKERRALWENAIEALNNLTDIKWEWDGLRLIHKGDLDHTVDGFSFITFPGFLRDRGIPESNINFISNTVVVEPTAGGDTSASLQVTVLVSDFEAEYEKWKEEQKAAKQEPKPKPEDKEFNPEEVSTKLPKLLQEETPDVEKINELLRGLTLDQRKQIKIGGTKDNPLNLSGKDLSGVDLADIDLSNVNLSGAVLQKAYMLGVNLQEADLSGANLSGAKLYKANLSEANLSEANLSEVILLGAEGLNTIEATHMHGADLKGVIFDIETVKSLSEKDAPFIKEWARQNPDEVEKLQEAHEDIYDKLTGYLGAETPDPEADKPKSEPENKEFDPKEVSAKLLKLLQEKKPDVEKINELLKDLSPEQREQIKIGGTEENPLDLSGKDLSGVKLQYIDLSNVNLSGANLSDASLYKANLQEADLSGVNLSNANLRGAYLPRANLSGANLSGADMSGAPYLEDITGGMIKNATLKGVILGVETIKSLAEKDAPLIKEWARQNPDEVEKLKGVYEDIYNKLAGYLGAETPDPKASKPDEQGFGEKAKLVVNNPKTNLIGFVVAGAAAFWAFISGKKRETEPGEEQEENNSRTWKFIGGTALTGLALFGAYRAATLPGKDGGASWFDRMKQKGEERSGGASRGG